jgi:hypothetical protein
VPLADQQTDEVADVELGHVFTVTSQLFHRQVSRGTTGCFTVKIHVEHEGGCLTGDSPARQAVHGGPGPVRRRLRKTTLDDVT